MRHSGQFREILDKRTDGGKRDKNRGYIAVAHELRRVAYVVWSKDVSYTENPAGRPGHDRRSGRSKTRGDSRSGMGQPDVPMVVAS